MNESQDDDVALEPAAMLALMQNQQRSIERQVNGFVPVITLGWALTWLLGFGALWLIDGLRPAFALPVEVAVWFFVVCVLATGALSAILGIRSGRGLRGNTAAAFTGTVYGITWGVGATALGVLGAAFRAQGMTAELANFYYPSAYVLFAGIMYMIAGGIWRTVPSLIAGAWLVMVAAAAPFFGYPHHYLFIAVTAGGAFLALSAIGFAELRRVRNAANGGTSRG